MGWSAGPRGALPRRPLGAEAGEEAGVRVEDAALETDCQQLYKLFGEAILPFVPTAYARLNIAPC